jgi:hypothetical protein
MQQAAQASGIDRKLSAGFCAEMNRGEIAAQQLSPQGARDHEATLPAGCTD